MPLYTILSYLAEASSSSSGFFGSLESNVAGAVIAAIVIAAVTSFIARNRKKREVKKKDEASANEKLDKALLIIDQMHIALVGADPTDLSPNPPAGLVKDVALIKRTLYENGGKGNTVLDRLDRMEKKVAAGVAGVNRVETRQTELRDAVAAGDPHA